MSDLIAGFADLFDGRHDAYGVSDETGVRCTRAHPPLTMEELVRPHLEGTLDIGVYPMVPGSSIAARTSNWDPTDQGWYVRWGCVDLDVKAPGKRRYDFDTQIGAWNAAMNLWSTANAWGVKMWPEITKSGGMHVWCFAEDWVTASTMRRALLFFCEESGTPSTEVNPKNEGFASPDQLGNFVRLPYFGSTQRPIVTGWKQGDALDLKEFVDCAAYSRTANRFFDEGAGSYTPPSKPVAPLVGEPVEIDRDWLRQLPPLLKHILREGMGKSNDRSAWLYSLAYKAKDEGLTPEEALTLVSIADDIHCQKYTNRADADQRMAELVGKVYS